MLRFGRFRKPQSITDETYQKPHVVLSPQEFRIFMLLREGFSIAECSQRLNIKKNIVRKNFKTIMNKLNVSNKADLIIKYKDMEL